mmetsp:Transcript_11304/g.20058  ORF Transcript_11304/g.20058 Transcript_11304/m.20058 type:complete len:158 (-) Transcript_11304:111-584(-)|eukprot:CAMPEP_0197633286 /NCGR_PEP_ID=MMETSP1338-20131121/9693_1 /TAXON_ID=43686 ORGANISM="Pelagodinium beii, Strain RCC1491" /NCGR_SAMPLE_ID=MMETSP1338 /ASSEMBLY_ACC=CAM_ASM_000754 /LENGTH=157 /DNA_ID=CAMNT_0043204923 /DNA_START=50 /DNA_END=523 /DNA_ORIENTATION=-
MPSAIVDVEPPPTEGPFPGESPETMDDLRQECAVLRQQVQGLESENAELQQAVREWRRWYAQSYRPQMEFLDAEVSRMVAMGPLGRALANPPTAPAAAPLGSLADPMLSKMSSTAGQWRPPFSAAPPGLRRQASDPSMKRKTPKRSASAGKSGLPPL